MPASRSTLIIVSNDSDFCAPEPLWKIFLLCSFFCCQIDYACGDSIQFMRGISNVSVAFISRSERVSQFTVDYLLAARLILFILYDIPDVLTMRHASYARR